MEEVDKPKEQQQEQAQEEHHTNTHRYYPATKKDHGHDFVKHNYCEHTNVGIDTNTHTSRYVPAQKGH